MENELLLKLDDFITRQYAVLQQIERLRIETVVLQNHIRDIGHGWPERDGCEA